jgi:nitrate/nitrite transport system ATP-binding protein
MSGGMQQRVCLARLFAIKPRVLLLDEPFCALDALTRLNLQEYLLGLWQAERHTVVMVTHDVDEAIILSDRILVMDKAAPAGIREDMRVSFSRPREGERLQHDRSYYELRAQLLSLLRQYQKAAQTCSA